ncbi:MAG: hypothetical protein CSYNP_04215 [Syntrophus sp. SKADARSKE-3]|nr:hypothetical protein [Syntrophus sp. SKADARSKE-3]
MPPKWVIMTDQLTGNVKTSLMCVIRHYADGNFWTHLLREVMWYVKAVRDNQLYRKVSITMIDFRFTIREDQTLSYSATIIDFNQNRFQFL